VLGQICGDPVEFRSGLARVEIRCLVDVLGQLLATRSRLPDGRDGLPQVDHCPGLEAALVQFHRRCQGLSAT
jgi:hypothetical protein